MQGLQLDPAALREELATFSQALARSTETLANIRTVDVWQTAKTEIYRCDKVRLYHCPAQGAHRSQTPLLISYALVNRIYMIDLEPERSLLRRLVESGLDVYLIDWGYPDRTDRFLDLDDYINGYLDSCVDQVRTHANSDQVDLLGICQGGTFSLCYSAIYPDKVRKLITMVTPVDFHTSGNILTALSRHVDADLAVACYGNLPGELLNSVYASLMPIRLGVQKYLSLPNTLQNESDARSFLRMETWLADSPDLAGEAFKAFFTQFFRENRLIKGGAMIGEETVDLKNITQPVLNIFGTHDHLVPPSASLALKGACNSSAYEELEISAGHIGVFVSGKAQTIVAPKIVKWLSH